MKRAPLVFAALLLAACSTRSPTTTRPTPETSREPAFVNGGECSPATEPGFDGSVGCVSRAGALVVFARVGEDKRPFSWHTRLDGVTQRLHAGNDFSYPRAIGEIDVDDDGDPEWLIKTFDLAGHGTNWQQLGLFVERNGRLRQVTLDGEPLAIRVGGISRMGEGARCLPGRLVLLRAVAENRRNTVWSYSETTYRIRGSAAHKGPTTRGSLRLRNYNDPGLDPYYAIDCDGSTYP